MRKWHPNHNIGMEFRCFVKDGNLIGITQKDDTANFPFLSDQELSNTIYTRIRELVPRVTTAMAPLDSYLLDVYIDIAPRYKVWVQDFSPFLQGCSRL